MGKKSLLRIVSVFFLIWACMNLLTILGIDACAGVATGALFGSITAGFALANLLQVGRIVNVIFTFVAGIAGYKGKNRGLCYACGIIILISAIITFLGNLGGDWSLGSVISALISVSLPLLYFVGVKRAF